MDKTFEPEQIFEDRGASVILRRVPRQLHMLGSNLFGFSSFLHLSKLFSLDVLLFLILLIVFPHCPHLIRLEQPWFAWHVEDVHEASCFKAEVDTINFYSFAQQVLHLSAAIYIVQDSQNRHNTRNTIAYVKLNIHDNDHPRS